MKHIREQVRNRVESQVESQVWGQIWSQVRRRVLFPVGEQVRILTMDLILDQVIES